MGWAEIGVVLVVGLIVFGPERLPDLARQAAGFIRTVRRMADDAKNDLGREMGQDLSELNLRDLDPREVVRKSLFDADDDRPRPGEVKETRILRPGETPPFDDEAT